MRKAFLIFFLALFLGSSFVAGCTPARKPVPGPTDPTPGTNEQAPGTTDPAPGPVVPAPAPTENINREPTGEQQRADKIAREVVRVEGVRKATVVVSDKTAYVGVEMDNRDDSSAKRVKKDVVNRAMVAVPTLSVVNVTADPDLLTRLRKVSDGVKSGKPVSTFNRELTEISGRITPQGS